MIVLPLVIVISRPAFLTGTLQCHSGGCVLYRKLDEGHFPVVCVPTRHRGLK